MQCRLPQMPDYVYLLHIMHNVGAIDPERALSIEEISCWASMDKQKVEENLTILIENGYAQIKAGSGSKKYFITVNGIRKVLSIYS
ncbi:MAG: hypothetical protein QXH24_05460 [Candidatus Bathyarchaeia archaeon]